MEGTSRFYGFAVGFPGNIKPTLNQRRPPIVLAGGENTSAKMSILEGWTSSWGIDHSKLIFSFSTRKTFKLVFHTNVCR